MNIVVIAIVAGAAIFIFRMVTLLKKARTIDAEGILTEAEVSRIERDLETADTRASTYYYVKYRDELGVERESVAAIGSDVPYEVGQKVRIRFMPGDYEMVRFVKE